MEQPGILPPKIALWLDRNSGALQKGVAEAQCAVAAALLRTSRFCCERLDSLTLHRRQPPPITQWTARPDNLLAANEELRERIERSTVVW